MSKSNRVLLASMPWASCYLPSLGLGVLKAQLKKKHIKSRVKHFNLFLLEHLSVETYSSLSKIIAFDEFVFTYIFEQTISQEQEKFCRNEIENLFHDCDFAKNERYNSSEKLFELILLLRNKIIPSYLDDCLDYVKEFNPTMVGFTCMFDQTIASLALAKKIKEYNPNIFIVFGGSAIDGVIGEQLIKSFSFIDCIAFGASENIITGLVQASTNEKLLELIPNICYRKKGSSVIFKNEEEIMDINESPPPNYDDFLIDLKEILQTHKIDILWETIPITFSRGCWWGEKHHCVFCGVKQNALKYNFKIASKALSEIDFLQKKYKKNHFLIADYILPYQYYKSFVPIIAERNKDSNSPIFFISEFKANVQEDIFATLQQAGFIELQPGIESFSSNILKKMSKGVTGIQNILCLILGIKYKVNINYNIIYGFPSDEEKDYQEMLKVLPLLYHLRAPLTLIKVAITRDAPLQSEPAKYGIALPPKYLPRYNILFSQSFQKQFSFDLNNFCYYFDYTYENSSQLKANYLFLTYQVNYWKESQQKRDIRLFYKLSKDNIVFVDSRYGDIATEFVFNKLIADVYLECACKIVSIPNLIHNLQFLYLEQEILYALTILKENRFLFEENDSIIGLAFHETVYEQQ